MGKLLLTLIALLSYSFGYDNGKKEEKAKDLDKWNRVADQIDELRKEFRAEQESEKKGDQDL